MPIETDQLKSSMFRNDFHRSTAAAVAVAEGEEELNSHMIFAFITFDQKNVWRKEKPNQGKNLEKKNTKNCVFELVFKQLSSDGKKWYAKTKCRICRPVHGLRCLINTVNATAKKKMMFCFSPFIEIDACEPCIGVACWLAGMCAHRGLASLRFGSVPFD